MTTSTAEQAAIAAIPGRLVSAWAAHDADAFATLFTDDGTIILPGTYQKGRGEIRDFMAGRFAGAYRGTRVTGEPIDIKPLGQDAAVLITEGGVLAPGESVVSATAAIRACWILVKRDGQWLLSVYQNCPRDLNS